jgi:FkbH-like protein
MERSLFEYISLSEELEFVNHKKKIKIGLLSSFTINGLSEILKIKCHEKQILCQTFMGNYNQYPQEILDKNSSLYKFNPDITFLILDTRSILEDLFYHPYSFSVKQKHEFIRQKLNHLYQLIQQFTKNSSSKLIISNISIPSYSPYGIAESNSEFGFHDMVLDFNKKLKESIQEFDLVFIFDFDRFVRQHGEDNIFNYQNYFFGDIKIALNSLPFFGDSLMSYVIAQLGISKKCIVLDLDNTLWGGIIGEDGFDGINLGSQPPGNVFLEFQKHLKALSQRGIILAINSKNNFDDAMNVINNHPYMILREEDFACIVINWGDKVENIHEISKELNIGLDSLVFFDDDPVNRNYVRRELPQILVPELPSDPSQYSKILLSLNDFSTFQITDEDTKRKQMYSQQKKRVDLKKSNSNLLDYLKTLDLHVIFKKADDFTIPRISQLTLKTNQFNLTTKRYQKEDIIKFRSDKNMLVGSAQVSDKFGDNGITGVYIVDKNNSDEWILDTFLLSCRVMGREIEKVMLNSIIEKAKKNNTKKIKAQFIPTQKNSPIEDFLPSCGFQKEGNWWIYNLENSFNAPNFVTVEEQ